MKLSGVRPYIAFAIVSIALAACSGGGGGTNSVPQPTSTPTLAPTSTPTPIITGTPGPTIASWKGDGSFNAQSDPNWPLSFIPEPGDPAGSYTKGPPISYTAVGQSVTVSITQSNFSGILPTIVYFTGNCTGITGSAAGANQFRVSYNSVGHSSCTLQLNGANNGAYQGFAALLVINVPAGG